MQTVVDLIIPNDRVASRSDLHPGQCVAMDIVVFQNTTPVCKEIHAPLESPIDLVVLESRIAFTGYPYACVRVGENFVLDKLTTPLKHSKIRWKRIGLK